MEARIVEHSDGSLDITVSYHGNAYSSDLCAEIVLHAFQLWTWTRDEADHPAEDNPDAVG